MGPTFERLPPNVAAGLRAYARAKQVRRLLRVAAATALVYVVAVLVAAHLDRFLFLDGPTRVRLFWTVHAAAGAACAGLLAVLALRRVTARRVAYEVEGKLEGRGGERIVTLENVLARGGDAGNDVAQRLVGQLADLAGQSLEGVKPARLVEDRTLRWLAGALGAALLLCGLLAGWRSYEFPLMLGRFFLPHGDLPRASFLELSVKPDGLVVGRGGGAVIQAEVSGAVPAPIRWLLERLGSSPNRCVVSIASGEQPRFAFADGSRQKMNRVHRTRFLLARGELKESFSFRVRCGDAESRPRVVRVVAQPRILDVRLALTPPEPPEYTGLRARIIEDATRPLRALPGTRVRLSFRTDQPVAERKLLFEGAREPVEPQWDPATRTGTHVFEHTEKATIEIAVTNKHGFANVERVKVVIGMLEDMPPAVRLAWPASDIEAVPGELVPIEAECRDDLGLAEAAARYVLNPEAAAEAAPSELPVDIEKPGARALTVATALDLAKTGAVPGDTVAVRVRARDSAGNDGESREVFIRVVPFTRGENERRRLAALRGIQAGLLAIAAGAEEAPALSALLEALEREHHFTDAPRHKEDVRKLAGVLRAWAAPLGAKSRAANGDSLAERLKRLAAEVLPGLTAYRRLENLTWRLFGMRSEAARIADALARLAGESEPAAATRSAALRRARLYLDTLQDIGDELVELCRTVPQLDEAKLKERIGDLNTAGYYMRRGSAARRRAACGEVAEQIEGVLAEVRPALAGLLPAETAARAKLDTAYAGCLAAIMQRRDGRVDPATLDANVRDWLAADGRMMARNPFLPLWPRLANFALAAGADPAAFESESALAEAVARQRVAADGLAFAWEAEAARDAPGTSDEEVRLELELLEREQAQRRRDVPTEADVLADERLLADAAMARLPFPGLGPALDRLIRRLNGTATQLDAQTTRLQDQASAAEAAAAILAAVRRDADQVHDLASRIELRLALRAFEGASGPRAELALLAMRDAVGRFTARAAPLAAALRTSSAGQPSAGELTRLHADAVGLRTLHAGMLASLEKLRGVLQETGAPEPETARYAVLGEFARTRRYVETLATMLRGDEPRAAARRFVAEFPWAGVQRVLAHAPLLASARQALAEAADALKGAAVRTDVLAQQVAAARSRLEALAASVSAAGEGEFQARVDAVLARVLRRLRGLGFGEARPEAADVQRQRFALDALLGDLRRLAGEFEAAAAEEEGFICQFRGGPPGIWTEAHRHDAEHARRRLLGQARLARQRLVQGVLEGLADSPRRERLEEGFGWALLLHRLVRSELCGVGGVRAPREAGRERSNPHLRFLLSELEKARKVRTLKHYKAATKEYLDAVADFLRY
ncbi:MAG: hypothetical protein ACOC8A_01270 [bacterium]